MEDKYPNAAELDNTVLAVELPINPISDGNTLDNVPKLLGASIEKLILVTGLLETKGSSDNSSGNRDKPEETGALTLDTAIVIEDDAGSKNELEVKADMEYPPPSIMAKIHTTPPMAI